MKTITIKDEKKSWLADYEFRKENTVLYVVIAARSDIEVVVAKLSNPHGYIEPYYYIASPNFGVAIPGITSLAEKFWITEKLIHAGMPAPDAETVAQVLRDIGDY